jgi:hypothetical protein
VLILRSKVKNPEGVGVGAECFTKIVNDLRFD